MLEKRSFFISRFNLIVAHMRPVSTVFRIEETFLRYKRHTTTTTKLQMTHATEWCRYTIHKISSHTSFASKPDLEQVKLAIGLKIFIFRVEEITVNNPFMVSFFKPSGFF